MNILAMILFWPGWWYVCVCVFFPNEQINAGGSRETLNKHAQAQRCGCARRVCISRLHMSQHTRMSFFPNVLLPFSLSVDGLTRRVSCCCCIFLCIELTIDGCVTCLDCHSSTIYFSLWHTHTHTHTHTRARAHTHTHARTCARTSCAHRDLDNILPLPGNSLPFGPDFKCSMRMLACQVFKIKVHTVLLEIVFTFVRTWGCHSIFWQAGALARDPGLAMLQPESIQLKVFSLLCSYQLLQQQQKKKNARPQ